MFERVNLAQPSVSSDAVINNLSRVLSLCQVTSEREETSDNNKELLKKLAEYLREKYKKIKTSFYIPDYDLPKINERVDYIETITRIINNNDHRELVRQLDEDQIKHFAIGISHKFYDILSDHRKQRIAPTFRL